MTVSVNQIAGVNFETADFNRLTKIHKVRIRVRNRYTACEQVKTGFLHGWQVANGAIRYTSHAMDCQADTGMDLADECTDSGLMVNILQYHDARFRDGENVLPPIHAIVIATARHGRRRRASSRRDGIAQHRLEAWELAVDASVDEAFIPQPHVKPLDGVRHSARV
jgi:hypothetical protein